MTTADKKPGIDKPGFDGEWVRAKLLDVCDFRGGTQPPKSEWIKEPRPGYVRMLQIRDYSQDSLKYAEYVKDSSSLHKCEKTDIMLSRYGYIGQVFTGLEGAYNVALVKVVKKVSADTRYLFYYFESDYFKKTLLASTGSRATIQGFNKSELANAEINLPDKTTQRRIPKILELLDSLIEISNKIVLLLDDLVKSQFVEMFGDATSIASKWNQIPFGECLAVFESGNSPSCSNAPREDDNPAVLKLSALSSGRFIAGENKAMLEGEDINPDKEVKRGDILIARKNTPELVGSCAIVRDEVKNLMFPDIVFRVHPRDNVSGEYLCELLSGPSFSGKLKSLAHGSAKSMSNISKTALERLPVPLPPLSLQQQFADFVARVDKLRFDVQQQIERLEILKQSLMQEYFG